MIDVVAKRYAGALVDVLAGTSTQEAVEAPHRLRAFVQAINDHPNLETILISPAVAASRKRAVVERLADSMKLPAPLRNFLKIIVDRGRIQHLEQMAEAVEQLLDERLGILRIRLVSARPLPGPLASRLEDRISKITGKTVEATFSTDNSLIGGVVAEVGSTIFDGSVRGQLDAMRRRLSAEG